MYILQSVIIGNGIPQSYPLPDYASVNPLLQGDVLNFFFFPFFMYVWVGLYLVLVVPLS